MIYHRMKPVWKDNELRYLICTVESSTVRETGNLRMYNKDESIYEEYNLKTKRWERKTIVLLTEHEKVILMLARQGKTTREIANDLCKAQNTIQNQIKQIFSKLNAHSTQEALEFVGHHRMLYPKRDVEPQPIEAPYERSRVLLTEDMFQRIQQHLDDGKSIRQAARLEGLSESAVRYWMGKGRLEK
jgi:DNA-binding CsgD family transcriptional regulator